ncbi:terminase large subunit [Paracoccus sulfuroxidans]|uniref:Phage terminase large subunit-like protein n=1 Tax=Paracoccus sulfuroxidans TaxID=384678 RepID=A0A562NCG4_9RHOB|nr:terminase large subunit [Paracoccus sulfuroxidans]TWI29728.1 phage terminase large subunit-like protein [Paracoccus sulfuroxidans]
MTVPIRDSAWSTAVPDWEDRIKSRRSLVPDLPLFDDVAEKALRIFKRLRVPDIIGTPTYGEVCGEWVFDFVRAVFGSYDPDTKRRMIREFFLLVPKKNGKSSIAAAIMVTAIILNERPLCELLLIAPTIAVAGISYDQALGIIDLDEDLLKLLHPQPHLKTITHRITGAVLSIKSADPKVVTGTKAAYVLIDELHEFAEMSRAAAVMREIKGGLAARPDGFLLTITTQSKKPPAGVFKSELDKARAVRDGDIVLPLVAVLYELPLSLSKDGGWKDPKTWSMVNPALGASVQPEFLADELVAAEADGIEALVLLASQHFNVQIGMGLRADRWPGALHWEKCGDASLTLDELIRRSEVCVVGVDGGGLDDLFAMAVIGREEETRDWLHWAHAWAYPDVLEYRKEIAPRLKDFEAAGELTICETIGDDVRGAVDIIERLELAALLPRDTPAVGLDAHGIAELLDELEARGFGDDRLISVGQGWKLQQAVVTLPRRLKNRQLIHGGSDMMAWNVGNAKAELKGSNYIVTKQVAGSAKIDALMATFNAAMLMFGNPVSADAGRSSYFAALGAA